MMTSKIPQFQRHIPAPFVSFTYGERDSEADLCVNAWSSVWYLVRAILCIIFVNILILLLFIIQKLYSIAFKSPDLGARLPGFPF